MPFHNRLQIILCFWVKMGKALVSGCLISKGLKDLEGVLKQALLSVGLFFPFKLDRA